MSARTVIWKELGQPGDRESVVRALPASHRDDLGVVSPVACLNVIESA